MTATKTQAPRPKTEIVKFNADGKAESGYDTIAIPLPDECRATARVGVGCFPRSADRLPGWYAEAALDWKWPVEFRHVDKSYYQSAAGRERWHAIVDAVEGLTNHLVDAADRARGGERKRLSVITVGLNAWSEGFETQSKKEEGTVVIVNARSKKILDSKECRALLEDFRRSYKSCQHAFLELGEKATAIRDQEAFNAEEDYGEKFETFDEWIKANGYGHTFVYDCMKAARLYRLMAPCLEPRKITLDCESHYRDIPADVTPKQAKAIAAALIEILPEGDAPRVTRQQVKAAVAAVRPKPAAARAAEEDAEPPPAKVTIQQNEWVDPREPEPPAPRLAPESITGEYREVVACEDDRRFEWNGKKEVWANDLHAFRDGILQTLAPMFDRHGHDKDFLYALAMLLHDLSVEAKYREPPAPAPAAAASRRRAK